MVWGLERGKHFVMGATNLIIGVDHKPLVGLYSRTRPSRPSRTQGLGTWQRRRGDTSSKHSTSLGWRTTSLTASSGNPWGPLCTSTMRVRSVGRWASWVPWTKRGGEQ
jgi:hypothetical protein